MQRRSHFKVKFSFLFECSYKSCGPEYDWRASLELSETEEGAESLSNDRKQQFGHQFGKGDGKDAATVAGAVAGGYIGGQMGTAQDQAYRQPQPYYRPY